MKKLLKYFGLSLIIMAFLVPSINAKADVSTLRVTDMSKDSISVSWTAPKTTGTITYYLGISKDKEEALANCNSKNTAVTQTSYVFTNLEAGKGYYIYLKYLSSTSTEDIEKKGVYASLIGYTMPPAPSNVEQSFWSTPRNKTVITWDAIQGATGYKVDIVDNDGEDLSKTVETNSITLTTKDVGYYKVKVCAYITLASTNKTYYGDYSNTIRVYAQPLINETDEGYDVSIQKKKMSLSWGKVSQAQGYEIWVSTKKNGPYTKVKTINNKNTTSAKINKLNGKKFNVKGSYYVFVCGFRVANNVKSRTSSNYLVYYNNKETYLTLRK